MMKSLKFIFDFYRSNKLASILLFLVFTVAVFFSSFALGQYRYLTYARDIFMRTGLNDSLYFMPTGFDEEAFSWDALKYLFHVEQIQNNVKALPGVESIVPSPWILRGEYQEVPGTHTNLSVFEQSTYDAFSLPVNHGTNDLKADPDYNPEKPLEVVAYGYEYHDLKEGEIYTLFFLDKPENKIKIKVVGKSDHEPYLPNMGAGGTGLSAQHFLERGSSLVCVNSPALSSYLKKISMPSSREALFVAMKPDVSKEEKENIVNYLNQNGYFLTYDQILENTNEDLIYTMKDTLPMPMFFLFVSSIALISISVLFVYKNIKKNSIYYICGCSSKKIFFYMACGIGLISIIAGIINIAVFANMNRLTGEGILNLGYSYYFDYFSISFIIIYISVVLLISIGIPYLVYRKLSPIELYRRVQ